MTDYFTMVLNEKKELGEEDKKTAGLIYQDNFLEVLFLIHPLTQSRNNNNMNILFDENQFNKSQEIQFYIKFYLQTFYYTKYTFSMESESIEFKSIEALLLTMSENYNQYEPEYLTREQSLRQAFSVLAITNFIWQYTYLENAQY